MIECPTCSTKNLPGMAYCEDCGTALVVPSDTAVSAGTLPGNASVPATQSPQISVVSDQSADVLSPQAPAAVSSQNTPSTTPPLPATSLSIDSVSTPAKDPEAAAGVSGSVALPPMLALVFPDGTPYAITHTITNIGRSDIAQNWHPELDLTAFGGSAPDFGVSRHQARILRDKETSTWTLIDVGSTNGTFVNGKMLAYNKPVELHEGDTIAFGAFQAKVRSLTSAPPDARMSTDDMPSENA